MAHSSSSNDNSNAVPYPLQSLSHSRSRSRKSSRSDSQHSILKHEPSHFENDRQPSLEEDPRLAKNTAATNLELFYDLFLTANLTVFTNIHEVKDHETLKQYVGFFCILWFTWYQVGLYDVRFQMDSVFERIAKAVQFIVMMGFAIVGPKFNVGAVGGSDEAVDGGENSGPSFHYFKMLSIFLMISRLVLVLQYFLVMWLTRKYKHHALPIGLLAGTYFLAAMVYLGLFFTFHLNLRGVNHSYIFWYITAILETIIATGISSVWRNISFKGTHLVERMSLLTLIILGEGVIGIAKSFQKIVQSEGALRFTASTVANVVCAVLILYMIYMIYFDWNDEEHFGTIRQQIWSALHFPLHLALVLAVEGVSQCITWRAAVVQGNRFNKQFGRWNEDLGDGLYTEVAESINTTAIYLIHRGLLTSKSLDQTMEMLTHDLGNINNATNIIRDGGEDPVLARDALYWTYFTLYRTIYNIAGFDSPAKHSPSMNATAAMPDEVDFADEVDAEKAVQSITQTADVFNLIYVYFFTSIGLVIILCCVIAALSNRQKSKLQNLRLIGSGLIGLGLGLLSIADSTVSGTRFAFSAFLLPTVALAMAIVVVFNAIKPVLPKMPGFSRVRSTSRGRERSV